METINKREAWNKGKLVGKKPPVKPKDIWAIHIHIQNEHAFPDLAMFNLAIGEDSASFDRVCRAGFVGLWDAVDAENQSNPDPKEHEEPARPSAATWPFEAGEYGSLPRH